MPLPVLSVAQMRDWESATWATGQTEQEVIRRVGKTVAAQALALTKPGQTLLILAGKGNNGADATSAQPHVMDRSVEVLRISDPATDLPTLQSHLAPRPALIIDGLFGIGLNRPLSPEWVQFIEEVNRSGILTLAVDVPSGLNADTGEHYGAAVQAALTLTIGAPKAGLLDQRAWPFTGRVEVTPDVGLVPCPVKNEVKWIVPGDFADYPPRRPIANHKGSYGHLAIVAGSPGYHGAAVLAARGAQRAQPGLITLHAIEPVYTVIAPQLQAVMVTHWQPDPKLPGSWSAILLGPGLASQQMPDQMKMQVRLLWRDAAAPVIVDASALDWLPLEATPRNAIRVLTPHPGEAARLLRSTPEKVQANRPAAVREISKRYGGAWVVLKGHQTIIGRASGELYVNPSGNPHLAQGGTGDVLSGYVAGLLAQPPLRSDVGKLLCYAVFQHGAAADRLQARHASWIVEDLLGELGRVGATG